MSERSRPAIGPEGAHRERAHRLREAALIAAVALVLNLAGNGRMSLWDRDEPRYAVCTREMQQRGDWISPTFNAEPRFHKPVLIYWLMRAGYAIGGDNPFGARLVSVLAGTTTCLVVLAMGRRMFGPRAGFLSALMLTTAPIMVIESKLATTDATLALFLVLAHFCLWELSRRPSRRLAAAFWVLMALATLTKGPVGLALVACSGLASWWWGGPTSVWRRLHWRWGPALFLLVAAPWFIAVGLISHGEFFRYALNNQIARRMVHGVETHGGIPGYYLLTSVLTFHPWSALLPPALYGAWSRRKARPEFGFLLGWVVGPLVLLECVRTKMVHYYLPAYPACALLAGWMVGNLADAKRDLRSWPLGRLGVKMHTVVGAGLAALFVVLAFRFPTPLRGPCLAAAAAAVAATALGTSRLLRSESERAVFGLAASWALTLFVLASWLLPAAEPYKLSRIVGERLVRVADECGSPPILLSFQEPSVIYAMGRPAPMIRTWPQFYEQLDRHGGVVAALIPLEVPEFKRRRTHLLVEDRGLIRGFNLNKGRTEQVWMVRVRRKPGVFGPEGSGDRLARREDLLVK